MLVVSQTDRQTEKRGGCEGGLTRVFPGPVHREGVADCDPGRQTDRQTEKRGGSEGGLTRVFPGPVRREGVAGSDQELQTPAAVS